MPSFTFVSTANAFCLRGARPVFIDIRPDTLNLNEALIEEAITEKTKAIVPVHYAGVSCEMDTIMKIAKKHNLRVIEDAAQGLFCKYRDRYLGTIGDVGCYSFHETKSFICGEGGAIAINRDYYFERAEIIREKGTNRTAFFNGKIDKYTWVDIGSSFLPSELTSSFLFGQLQAWKKIVEKRKKIFHYYQQTLAPLESQEGLITINRIPENYTVNYHLFHILVKDKKTRDNLLDHLNSRSIVAVFHYIPLHSSPYAQKLKIKVNLPVTDNVAERVVRLPFYNLLARDEQNRVVESIYSFFGKRFNAKQLKLDPLPS
jgi:dTDP-4-amino-4,6-dideoxygalactose transaminase